MDIHFTKEHSVRFYADQLSMHPNHLNALIKKHTGISAKESIQNKILLETKYHREVVAGTKGSPCARNGPIVGEPLPVTAPADVGGRAGDRRAGFDDRRFGPRARPASQPAQRIAVRGDVRGAGSVARLARDPELGRRRPEAPRRRVAPRIRRDVVAEDAVVVPARDVSIERPTRRTPAGPDRRADARTIREQKRAGHGNQRFSSTATPPATASTCPRPSRGTADTGATNGPGHRHRPAARPRPA